MNPSPPTPSSSQPTQQPLDADEARRRFRHVAENGTVTFTSRCLRELDRDDRSTQDCLNALRGGSAARAEWESGAWRYRVETGRVTIVIELVSEDALTVLAARRTAR